MNFGGKKAKVLYFFADAVSTEAEQAEVEQITGHLSLQLRNGAAAEGSIEQTDFVAGTVPDSYKDFPLYSAAKVKAFNKIATKEAEADLHRMSEPPVLSGGGPETPAPGLTPSPLAGGSAEAAAGLVPAPTGSQVAGQGDGEKLGSTPAPKPPEVPPAWGAGNK